jgi:hypothetical protein
MANNVGISNVEGVLVTEKQRECKCGVVQCGGGVRVVVGFTTKIQTIKKI